MSAKGSLILIHRFVIISANRPPTRTHGSLGAQKSSHNVGGKEGSSCAAFSSLGLPEQELQENLGFPSESRTDGCQPARISRKTHPLPGHLFDRISGGRGSLGQKAVKQPYGREKAYGREKEYMYGIAMP